jgi:hypothetical protein
MKTLSHGSQSPGRDLNPSLPYYETGVLTTQPQPSVNWFLILTLSYQRFLHPQYLLYIQPTLPFISAL